MFIVIFEVQPHPERWDDYLATARLLRPELERIDGFVDNERFSSDRTAGRVLSLSTWRDEKALIRWRTQAMHHTVGQQRGRNEIFADYRLRVGEVIADSGLPVGTDPAQTRFDETEVGPARAITVTQFTTPTSPSPPEVTSAAPPEPPDSTSAARPGIPDSHPAARLGIPDSRPAARLAIPDSIPAAMAGLPSSTSASISEAPDSTRAAMPEPPDSPALVDREAFTSLTQADHHAVLLSWRTALAAQAWRPPAGEAGVRHRLVRIIRDYGLRDRREAPQYFPPPPLA
jgi:heme-degrading monooxygenase HmoA